jgi:MscS family membrane protein
MELTAKQLAEFTSTITANPYLSALLIIGFAVALAKVFDVILNRLVRRILLKTRFPIDEQILDILHRPTFVSILILGLALATERLELPGTIHFVTVGGLKSVAILVWAAAGGRLLRMVVVTMGRRARKPSVIQESTVPLFKSLVIILVVVISAYFLLVAWQIDVTAWVASAGILGLAISFAARDTLANLISGVFILADAPYKIGDFIVLESGERGEVTQIGIRSTRLLTRDDVEITVPNSVMGNAKITNEAGGPSESYRIRIKVGVAYGSDLDKVHAVLQNVAEQHPEVCRTPEPRVRFRAFGNSSLDHELLCWVEKPVKRGLVEHLLNTEIYKRFVREGIQIPFPQRDLHLRSAPESLLTGGSAPSRHHT